MKLFSLKNFSIKNIKQKQKGFSLIEIAIAIVIMGLIVSITSRGKELVRTTKLRSINEQVNTFRMSTQLFTDKYNAIPGDLFNAKELIDSSLENGKNSGTITTISDAKRFWKHLIASGFLNIELIDGFPASNIGGYFTVSTNFKNIDGVWLILSRGTTDNIHFLGIISQEEAYFIDKKYDTGIPSTGDIRTLKIINGNPEVLGVQYDYKNKEPNCIIMFRLF